MKGVRLGQEGGSQIKLWGYEGVAGYIGKLHVYIALDLDLLMLNISGIAHSVIEIK